MFIESMFSTPRQDGEESLDDAPSAWPALGAALFAWIIALLRMIIARVRQESPDLDIALAFGATLLIPSIMLVFWLRARRGLCAKRIDRVRTSPGRPHLRLVSSAPAPRARRSA